MPWYDTNYKYKKQIVVDHTKVSGGSDLSNFPVLISMTDANLKTAGNGGQVQNASGFDIIFTNGNETTKLDHEIEKYVSTTGEIEMWVRIPTLSASVDTIIYLYYGNNSTVSSSQENKTGVWDSNFKGVYHLGNGTTLSVADSTGVYNGTNTGGTAAAGKVDGGASFSAVDGDIQLASGLTLSGYTALTISCWFNFSSIGAGLNPNLIANNFYAGSNAGFLLGQVQGSGPYVGLGNGSAWPTVNSSTVLSASTWYHIVATWDGSTITLYLNTVSQGTPASLSGSIASSGSPLSLGNHAAFTTNYGAFTLDEARISNVARSAGWITTEYNNQNSPSTFYSVGSAQNFPEPSAPLPKWVDRALTSTFRLVTQPVNIPRYVPRGMLSTIANYSLNIATRLRLAKFVDVASRFRLTGGNTSVRDIASRFRQRSADQFKDIRTRVRLRSADQLKDISSRVRLMSAAAAKDIQARFRQMSAAAARDVAARLRLALFKDISARLRQMSAAQLKDVKTRFRVAWYKDISSRLRLSSSYQSTILADSPIRYYRLGETSGTTIADIGSQGVAGSAFGTLTYAQSGLLSGDSATSIDFNGTTGFINAGSTGLPTGASPWSIEVWSRLDVLKYENFLYFGGGSPGVYLFTDGTTCKVAVSGTTYLSGYSLAINTTYYFCITYDGSTLTLYIGDAGTLHTFTLATGLTAALGTDVLYIANDPFSDFLAGKQQEAAWYATGLSSTRVAAHYSAGLNQASQLKDVATRFRQRSANQFKDITARLVLTSTGIKDIASRFRQRSANQFKDIATRLRLAKFVDISSRFRQRSANQLKNIPARLRFGFISGPLFPANNVWNRTILDLPVHSSSSTWIAAVTSTNYLHVKTSVDNNGGFPYNFVNNSTPTYSPTLLYAAETYTGPFPIPDNPLYEEPGNSGSDHHLLCLNTDTNVLYEMTAYSQTGSTVTGNAAWAWDLTRNDLPTPFGSELPVAANAASLPTLAGVVLYEEILTGEIRHALYVALPLGAGYGNQIWPATHGDGSTTGYPPEGVRFRLKSSVNISGYSATNQVILTALKKYGALNCDSGTFNDFRLQAAPDSRWNLTDLANLNAIVITDFEIVDQSGIIVSSTSAQVLPVTPLKDIVTRLRLMSASQFKDIASRFRLRSANQLKDVAARFKLFVFKDIQARLRLMSASQLRDVSTRFKVAWYKDIRTRLRLRSSDQLKDVASRFRIMSSSQFKDASTRFRQRSLDQTKDVTSRLRMMSASQFKDVSTRLRLRSADQLKDIASRFRLVLGINKKDIAARVRLRSADQLKDITSRLVLTLSSQRLKDIASRLRLQSAAQLKDVKTRLLLSILRTKDITTRVRLMSALQTKDTVSRFRLRSANQLRDVSARLRQMSALQTRDVATRLRQMSASQLKDVVSRLRLQSAFQLRDISGRVRLRSANTLRDVASRVRLISQPQARDTQTRYRQMSALSARDIAARYRQRSANQMRDVTLRLVLALAQQRSKDVQTRMRIMSAPHRSDLTSRLCLYERTPNADMRLRRGTARMRTRSGRAVTHVRSGRAEVTLPS